MKLKEVFSLTWLPVLGASLCCLSPLVLVLFGLGTVSFASSLADTLYGDYKWYFRSFGFVLLLLSVWWYYRKKGVCTLDAALRKRNEILNTFLLVLLIGVIAYIIWLYVVVHYAGVWLNIWE